jgi:alpha-1,2-mannosyltransferase
MGNDLSPVARRTAVWCPRWLMTRRGRQVAGAVLAAQLITVTVFALVYRPFDLRIYLWGGRAVWHGPALYHVLVAGNWYTYPPFSALAFTPLSTLPGWLVSLAWELASVAALAWLLRACLMLGGWPVSRALTAWATVAALCLEPVYHTLYLGQVNLFLTAAVVWDIRRLAAGKTAGWATGAAAAVKLLPGLFIFVYAAAGRWRDAARAAITFAACTAAGFVADPSASRLYWTKLWHDTTRVSAIYISNQSAYGAIARLAGTTKLGLWPMALAAALAAAGLAVAACQARDGNWLHAAATAGVTTLVASPISWTHHWTWAAPALLVLLIRPNAARTAAAAAGWLLFAIAPMWFTPWHGDSAEYRWHGLTTVVANSFLLAGLAYLTWTAWATWRERASAMGENQWRLRPAPADAA